MLRSYWWYKFNFENSVLPGLPELGLIGEGGEAAEALSSAAAAESGASDANKLLHIFGNPQHGLSDLVSKFGSEQAAFNAIQQATEAVVKEQGVTGVFEKTVEVGGETITVRGNVVDGAVKIGTAFK